MDPGAPFNVSEFLEKSIHENSSEKLTFFAGAGISIDSGLPNFITFGRNMIQRICGETTEDFIPKNKLGINQTLSSYFKLTLKSRLNENSWQIENYSASRKKN